MNRSTECEIVQDLMPFCVARAASKASTRLVLEHVKQCDECRRRYETLTQGKKPGFWQRHVPFQGDSSTRYLRWSIAALNLLTALLCVIVNCATDKRPTWSWIVVGALFCSGASVSVYIRTKTYRFFKAMACFSVLGLLLLGEIQLVLHNAMGVGGVWIWSVAIPIASIYLFLIWLSVLLCRRLKLNGFICIALILFLCFPAEIATTAIAAAYAHAPCAIRWVNAAGYVTASLAMLATGVWFELRSRRRDG